jgi:hypothetical protein
MVVEFRQEEVYGEEFVNEMCRNEGGQTGRLGVMTFSWAVRINHTFDDLWTGYEGCGRAELCLAVST